MHRGQSELNSPVLRARIVEVVRSSMPELPLDRQIGLEDDLRDAGLSSMAMVKLMLATEVAFDIAIPDADLTPDNFRSVRTVETLVARITQMRNDPLRA